MFCRFWCAPIRRINILKSVNICLKCLGFYKFFSTDEQHEGAVRLFQHPVNLVNSDIAVFSCFPDGEQDFTCLDSINSLWFTTQPPAEYAVVSFEDKTIQPPLNAHPWFAAGNFGVDCDFKDDGAIDLLMHYCPTRYEKNN